MFSGDSLVFTTHKSIQEWLEYDKPFKKDNTILAKCNNSSKRILNQKHGVTSQ